MISKEDMAIRLVEERARLGYSQADFAHQTGKSRELLRKYELGKTTISTDFMAQAAQLGIDVQYVLTGVRSQNMEMVAKHVAPHTVDKASPASQVQGNVNHSVIAGAGSTVNQINTQKHITRTKAEVKPGDEHLTDSQKFILTELVNEIVKLEAMYRTPTSAKTHRAVWASLNKHCKVTSYHLIPLESFDKAETYLRKWVGRLNSMRSAPKKNNVNWRKKRYAYIKINTKDGLDGWLRAYLQEKFAAGSLTDLSDDQLDKVYRAVASKKGRSKA